MSEKRFDDLPLTIQERCEKNSLHWKYINFLIELMKRSVDDD